MEKRPTETSASFFAETTILTRNPQETARRDSPKACPFVSVLSVKSVPKNCHGSPERLFARSWRGARVRPRDAGRNEL